MQQFRSKLFWIKTQKSLHQQLCLHIVHLLGRTIKFFQKAQQMRHRFLGAFAAQFRQHYRQNRCRSGRKSGIPELFDSQQFLFGALDCSHVKITGFVRVLLSPDAQHAPGQDGRKLIFIRFCPDCSKNGPLRVIQSNPLCCTAGRFHITIGSSKLEWDASLLPETEKPKCFHPLGICTKMK